MFNILEESHIVAILHKMRTEQANEAETELMNLSSDANFFNCMHNILRSNDEEWIKTMAACSLSRVFVSWIASLAPEQLSEFLIIILSDAEIKSINKRCLERTLINLFEKCDEALLYKWLEIIHRFLNNLLDFDTAYLLIACFAVAEIDIEFKYVLLNKTFLPSLAVKVSIETSNLLNELFKTWIVFMNAFEATEAEPQKVSIIVQSIELTTLINSTLELESLENLIVCFRNELSELNMLKYEALNLLKIMIEYCLKQKYVSNHPFEILTKLILKINRTLYFLANNKTVISRFFCDDLVVTLLSLETIYLNASTNNISFEEGREVIEKIIFPFLERDEDEIDTFEEEPATYLSILEDCCENQLMGNLKSEASKLLEHIIKSSNELANFAIVSAIESLKFGMQFVIDFKGNSLSINTAFLVLGICSFKLENVSKAALDLKIILCDQRLVNLQNHELAIMFFSLGYIFAEVFPLKSDGLHLLTFALSKTTAHPTTFFCALDFVENLIEEVFSQEIFALLLNVFQNDQKNDGMYHHIAERLIKTHYWEIPYMQMVVYVEIMLEKIKNSFEKVFKKEQTSTLAILNYFKVFELMLQKIREPLEIERPNQEHIFEAIWKITEYWPQSKSLELDDELTSVIAEYAKTVQSSKVLEILPLLIKNFQRKKYHCNIYFELFNCMIMEWPLLTLEPILEILKTILINNLIEINNNKKLSKKAVATTFILLQNFIAVHGSNISFEVIAEISSFSYRFIFIENSKFHKIVQARAFNLMFLCHMVNKIDNIYEQLTVNLKNNIYHGYDTDVILMCLAKEILKETNICTISYLLTIAVDIIISSDRNQEIIDKKKKKKAYNNKIDTSLQSFEELDEILEILETPFLKKPAKESLKSTIITLKQRNSEQYTSLINILNEDTKIKLSQYVSWSNNRVLRKIIGIKDEPILIENNSKDEHFEESETKNKRERVKLKRKNIYS